MLMDDTQSLQNLFTLLTLTQKYNSLVGVDMVEGEFAQQSIMDSLRSTALKIGPTESQTITIGTKSDESVSSSHVSSRLTVPAMDTNDSTALSSISVSISEYASTLYGNGTLNSNPIRLYLENVDSSLVTSDNRLEFVMANTYEVDLANYSRVIIQPCYNRRTPFIVTSVQGTLIM